MASSQSAASIQCQLDGVRIPTLMARRSPVIGLYADAALVAVILAWSALATTQRCGATFAATIQDIARPHPSDALSSRCPV